MVAVARWVISSLLTLGPPRAFASEIVTPEDAEELCRTSEPTSSAGDGDTSIDPETLDACQSRREYAGARSQRLMDLYSVTLSPAQFAFLPTEADLLTVSTTESFPLFGGAYALDLGCTMDLAFELPSEESAPLLTDYESGDVLLTVHFQLYSFDAPSSPYCVSEPDGSMRIRGKLMMAELSRRSGDEPAYRVETSRYQRSRTQLGVDAESPLSAPVATVLVSNLAFPEQAPSEADRAYLQMEAETRMLPCYQHGLALSGRLQGALVLTFELEGDGSLSMPLTTIDALDHDTVTGCVLGALDEITVPRDSPDRSSRGRMTVIFRLEGGPSSAETSLE